MHCVTARGSVFPRTARATCPTTTGKANGSCNSRPGSLCRISPTCVRGTRLSASTVGRTGNRKRRRFNAHARMGIVVGVGSADRPTRLAFDPPRPRGFGRLRVRGSGLILETCCSSRADPSRNSTRAPSMWRCRCARRWARCGGEGWSESCCRFVVGFRSRPCEDGRSRIGILRVTSRAKCVRSIPEEFVDSSSAILEKRRNMGCLAHGRIPLKPFGLPGRMDAWFQLEARRKNAAYVTVQVY